MEDSSPSSSEEVFDFVTGTNIPEGSWSDSRGVIDLIESSFLGAYPTDFTDFTIKSRAVKDCFLPMLYNANIILKLTILN